MAKFAYITGWRIDSEVLSLEWRQVDFAAGEVRLDPGKSKNGEGRTFPMPRELRELLDQQRLITENLQRRLKVVCPRVFHRAGRPIKSFRVAFRTACTEAGCPGRVLHDFRRTAVRNLIRAGIPEPVAMDRAITPKMARYAACARIDLKTLANHGCQNRAPALTRLAGLS